MQLATVLNLKITLTWMSKMANVFIAATADDIKVMQRTLCTRQKLTVVASNIEALIASYQMKRHRHRASRNDSSLG